MLVRICCALAVVLLSFPRPSASAQTGLCVINPVGTDRELRDAIACFNSLGGGDFVIALKANIRLEAPINDIVRPDGANENRPAVTLKNLTLRNGGDGALHYSCDEELGCMSVLESVTLRDNRSVTCGGALYLYEPMRIISSTLTGNRANDGGAICIEGNWVSLSIKQSAIYSNSAVVDGGAIVMNGNSEWASLDISNSTLSGNSAGGYGGAIALHEMQQDDLAATLVNVTIANNVAKQGAAFSLMDTYQTWESASPLLTLSNSVIATTNSGASDCHFGLTSSYPISYALASKGNNIEDGDTCLIDRAKAASDKVGGFAYAQLLGPLAANGGPTLTHLPPLGSAALKNGNAAVCASSQVGGRDQRGQLRGTQFCDSGAVEASVSIAGPAASRMFLPLVRQ
jgi:hypothetical protein